MSSIKLLKIPEGIYERKLIDKIQELNDKMKLLNFTLSKSHRQLLSDECNDLILVLTEAYYLGRCMTRSKLIIECKIERVLDRMTDQERKYDINMLIDELEGLSNELISVIKLGESVIVDKNKVYSFI